MLEASLAIFVMVIALASISQLLVVVERQRRLSREQSTATREVGNVMERVIARPWQQVAADRFQSLELSDAALRLPAARVTVEVRETNVASIPAKQVRVEFTWKDSGASDRAIDLTAWKFKEPAAE